MQWTNLKLEQQFCKSAAITSVTHVIQCIVFLHVFNDIFYGYTNSAWNHEIGIL